MDTDVECVKPFDPVLLATSTCILSQEPEEHAHFLSPIGVPLVSNAVMACSRGHLFLKQVIENLYWHRGLFIYNDILRATGPFMLSDEYSKFNQAETNRELIWLASADTFQPTTDSSMRDFMRSCCIKGSKHYMSDQHKSASFLATQARLCEKVLRQGFREKATSDLSYTDHHWTHSWVGVINDPYNIIGTNKYIDVQTLVQF